nr:hypothetical protein [Ruminococcus sp.]
MKKKFRRFTAAVSAAAMCIVSVPYCGTVKAADDYKVRDPFFNFRDDYNYYESEHFQFIWGNNGADSSRVTQEFLEANARNMESCWDVYMNELAMAPPSQSVEEYLRDGNEYKTNFYISGTGLEGMADDWAYMSWDSGGFAYMFCCVDSMQTNPPSWVLPHEFGHVMTAHQRGWNNNKYSYAWWEAIGNWYREQYLYSDYSNDDTGHGTDFFETYMKNMSFTFPCGRDYYASWAFLQYLTENPDNLDGYGADFVKKMLQEGQVDEYPFEQVERLAPADLKETLGMYAAHMAGLDFANGDSYRARLNELLAQGDWNWQQIYTMLEPVGTSGNTYAVPTERAPQFAGLNIIPLEVSGGDFTVDLKGLSSLDGADWRACIVQQMADGKCVYSPLFKSGEGASVSNIGAQSVYLAVIATPDLDKITKYGLPGIYDDASMFSESNVPFSSKERYPYQITVSDNVSMKKRQIDIPDSGSYSRHPNGGGLVATTASVDASVYVAPDAVVKDYAKVTGNVKLLDHAVVEGGAQVSGNAVVAGFGMVAENAVVSGNARIDDYAMVMGRTNISGNAQIIESACVYGNVTMTDNSVAKGIAFAMADGKLSGSGKIDGDYYDDSGKTVSKGTSFGWTSAQSYSDSRPYTENLIYAYDFTDDSSMTFSDRYTSTYGINSGALWEQERTSARGVLTFSGKQYGELDKSILYSDNLEIQLGLLNRDTAGNDDTVLYLGDENAYIRVSILDGAVNVELKNGESIETVTTDKDLFNCGEWANISIRIIDGQAAVLKDGNISNEKPVTIKPSDIANTAGESSVYRIGGGISGENDFNGSLDYVRFFNGIGEAPKEEYTEKEEINVTEPPTEEPTTSEPSTEEPTTDSDILYGDANCDGEVSVADATLILQVLGNGDKYHLSEQGSKNADCCDTGDRLSAVDA